MTAKRKTRLSRTKRFTQNKQAVLDTNCFNEKSNWFNDVLGYANDVVTGKKPSCKYEISACRRFLDDFERQKDPGSENVFSFAKAWKAISFIERLPHVKGHFASQIGAKRLIKLAPWQKFIVANIFGWVVRETQLRVFSLVYLRVPRKNGKSTLSAGIGLYMLCADGEAGAEVLCGATTLDQARKVYDPALQMVRTTPKLRDAYKLDGKEKSIKRPDGSVMQPLIGDPGDGGNPSCAIVDEYHEHDTDSLYQCMVTGMGARLQALMLIITTAGKNLFSPCYDMDKTARDMLDGVINMPHMFTVLYGVDEDDDWTDPELLVKANPNYGVSVGQDFVKKQLRTAEQKPAHQVDYKTKHLNIWCNEKNAYYNVLYWQKLHDADMRLDDYAGKDCWIGLDLARKRDLSAKVIVFVENSGGNAVYRIFTKFYIAESYITDNDSKMLQSLLQGWVDGGFIEVHEGNQIDFERIADDVIDDSNKFKIQEIAGDPWGMPIISSRFISSRLTAVDIPQHGSHLTVPVGELESAIDAGRIHHDGNPVMGWCVGNVVVFEYKGGRKMPDKQDNDSKIDGVSALLNAFARCVIPEEDSGPSIYEDRGIRTL